MKAYVIATGLFLGLLALLHLWRMIVEPHLARDPWSIVVTVAAATLSLGAWGLVRRSPPF